MGIAELIIGPTEGTFGPAHQDDDDRAGEKSANPTARTVSWLCPACKAVTNKELTRTRQRSEPAHN
jgi:hypothetical protein